MRYIWKQCFAALLSVALVFVLLPAVARAEDGVQYYDPENQETKTEQATSLTGETSWTNAWYVVDNNITISARVTVSGDVNLILADGCTLTASQGITVGENASLTIWGQSGDTGKLTATGGDTWQAGIGSDGENTLCGAININGGTIEATGGGWSAGIGGHGATVKINGGKVTATGGYNAAGIGGVSISTIINFDDQAVTITINGGTIEAHCGSGGDGAGIGAGASGRCNVTITGGTIEAYGGDGGGDGQYGGPGIGSQDNTDTTSTVVISGGFVNAVGGQNKAGIRGKFSTGSNPDGTAVIVYNNNIENTSSGNNWSGIFVNSNTQEMSVYGTPTLTRELSQELSKQFKSVVLTIQANATLTVDSGVNVTLTGESSIAKDGKLINNGSITNEGTITNHGTIDTTNGTFVNNGNIKNYGTIEGTITGNPLCTYCKLTADALAFSAVVGYTPPVIPISISNGGTEPAYIEKVEVKMIASSGSSASSDNVFEIIASENNTVAAGDTDISWKIKPRAGLPAGSYKGTITITYNGMEATTTEVIAAFTVFQDSGADAALHGQVTRGIDPVADADVTLKQGDTTVASAKTDSNGYYYFEGVVPGIYAVVVEANGRTMTSMVTITEEAGKKDLAMPTQNVSSKLEVKGDDTPAVVVDGLDKEAQANADSDPDKTVTVTMTVEAVTDGAADNTQDLQDSIDAIKSKSASSEHEYLDLTLEKTVSETEMDDVTTDITVTKNLITVVIPFDPTGKSNIVVYRYHDGGVDTLTRDENSYGEYFDVSDDAVTVHAKNFSVYAIGYTQEDNTPPSGPFVPPIYGVAVPARTEGGRVKADRATALPGSRVTLTVKPDEGYHFGSLTVNDRNGKAVKVTSNGDGTYTFTMPYGKVTVKAAFVKCGSLSFADLDTGAWYHDYADYVIAHGLMRGIGGGLFAPDGAVSRAQMVMVLWNMRGKPVVNYYMTYSDVSEGVWYSEAIRWAASEGIAVGYGDGRFGPDAPITREQMAAMVYRYEQKYGDGGFTGDWMYRLPFKDLDQISDWAFESVAWCNMKGVVTGKDNNIFDPQGPAKRSELASVLTRYCDENDIKQ